MPRPVGSKVIMCPCGGRVVGMPGKTMECQYCGRKHKIKKGKKK
jgi:hypothetical protein